MYRETEEFKKLHNQFRFSEFAKIKGISEPDIAKQEFLALYQKYGSNSAVFTSLGKTSNYWMNILDGMDFTSVLKPDLEVSDTLNKLSSKVPISLFTNFDQNRIRMLSDHLKIPLALFTNVLCGDNIAERKPALDGFYAIIDYSQVAPGQIIYVGDRVDVDVKPAKQLGIRTALLYANNTEADYCFEHFSDLLQLL